MWQLVLKTVQNTVSSITKEHNNATVIIKTKQLGIALQWDGARPFAEEEDDTLAEGWPQCTHEMGVCHNSAQSAEHTAHCKVDTAMWTQCTKRSAHCTLHSAKWTQCTDQMGSVGFMGHACRGDYCCHTAWTTQSPVITTCWLCYFAKGDAE